MGNKNGRNLRVETKVDLEGTGGKGKKQKGQIVPGEWEQ